VNRNNAWEFALQLEGKNCRQLHNKESICNTIKVSLWPWGPGSRDQAQGSAGGRAQTRATLKKTNKIKKLQKLKGGTARIIFRVSSLSLLGLEEPPNQS